MIIKAEKENLRKRILDFFTTFRTNITLKNEFNLEIELELKGDLEGGLLTINLSIYYLMMYFLIDGIYYRISISTFGLRPFVKFIKF